MTLDKDALVSHIPPMVVWQQGHGFALASMDKHETWISHIGWVRPLILCNYIPVPDLDIASLHSVFNVLCFTDLLITELWN